MKKLFRQKQGVCRALVLLGVLISSASPRALYAAAVSESQSQTARLAQDFQRADVVVVASLVRLAPSPRIWSGILATRQGAYYKVERTLKGSTAASEEILIWHPLVRGSKTADDREARLRDTLFVPGARLVIFARVRAGRLDCLNENTGVVPADATMLAALRALVPPRSNAPPRDPKSK